MKNNCRIKQKFLSLTKADKSALITFLTAGDPDFKKCSEILNKLPELGVDIIELGMPFSDPMADGPVIQNSYKRSLAGGNTMSKTINLVKDFRKIDQNTPIVLMGYYNPIYQIGIKRFLKKIKDAGVDGLLIVDLPPETIHEVYQEAEVLNIKLIQLASPTTDIKRIKNILKHANGFLYYISITGITGSKISNFLKIEKSYKKLKKNIKIPFVVGFGINSPSKAKNIASYADGVVIGSAIINQIDYSLKNKGNVAYNVFSTVKKYSKAILEARKK